MLAGLVLGNAVWLVRAGESVRRAPSTFARSLGAHLQAHPETRFFLSEGTRRRLARASVPLPENVTPDPRAERVAVLASEALERSGARGMPSNRRGLTESWFGPFEVNFDYYPTWQGRDRVLLLTPDNARRVGFPVERPGPGP